jgi:hypothetical protein
MDDAIQRLDMLTKEENLMTAARNLEATQHVDDKVTTIEEVVYDIDGNIKATKVLTHDVHENVIAIKEDARSVHDNVKVTRHGAQHSFKFFIHATDLRPSYIDTAMDDLQRLSLPHAPFAAHGYHG